MTPRIYVGLPTLSPHLLDLLRREYPGVGVMVSAHCADLGRWSTDMRDADEPHPGFRGPLAGRLDGIPAFLDSAGFTAMAHFGGFPWSPEQYAALAASHGWEQWASMDLCVEPQVARDRREVIARTMVTAANLDTLNAIADAWGIRRPLPVLQGWDAWDYEACVDAMGAALDGVQLVGLGSVCRRQMGGPTGIVAILDAIDRVLPAGIRVHLFGVKSGRWDQLAGHPRVASMDSMAWNSALRRDHPTGRTKELAADYLRRWLDRQLAAVAAPVAPPAQPAFPFRPAPAFAGTTPEYRQLAAECLHRIRNGVSDLAGWQLFRQLHG